MILFESNNHIDLKFLNNFILLDFFELFALFIRKKLKNLGFMFESCLQLIKFDRKLLEGLQYQKLICLFQEIEELKKIYIFLYEKPCLQHGHHFLAFVVIGKKMV